MVDEKWKNSTEKIHMDRCTRSKFVLGRVPTEQKLKKSIDNVIMDRPAYKILSSW